MVLDLKASFFITFFASILFILEFFNKTKTLDFYYSSCYVSLWTVLDLYVDSFERQEKRAPAKQRVRTICLLNSM